MPYGRMAKPTILFYVISTEAERSIKTAISSF
jgi:hypothetical protein